MRKNSSLPLSLSSWNLFPRCIYILERYITTHDTLIQIHFYILRGALVIRFGVYCLGSYLEVVEKNPLQNSFRLSTKSSDCGSTFEIQFPSMAVSCRPLSQQPMAPHIPSHEPLSIYKPATTGQVLATF